MSEEKKVEGGSSFEPGSLQASIAAREQKAKEEFEQGRGKPADKPTPESSGAEQKDGDTGKPAEGAPTDEQEGADGEEKPAEGEESADKKPEDEKPATIKLGNKEFATQEEAIAEANKIIGRNAQLSGDNNKLQEALAEAQRINEQWYAWYTAHNKPPEGDDDEQDAEEKPATPAAVADVVLEKLDAKERAKAVEAFLRSELEAIEVLPNYNDAIEIIEKIADKINPLTGKSFTPKEAYSFACRELGIQDHLKQPVTPPAPAPKPSEVPPKKPATEAHRAAARPHSEASPASKKNDEEGDKRDGFGKRMLQERRQPGL